MFENEFVVRNEKDIFVNYMKKMADHLNNIVKRYWVFSALAAFIVSPAIISTFLIIYAISYELPPLDILTGLGANIVPIGISTLLLLLLLGLFLLGPAIYKSFCDPINKEVPKDKIALPFGKSLTRWLETYSVGVSIYIIIIDLCYAGFWQREAYTGYLFMFPIVLSLLILWRHVDFHLINQWERIKYCALSNCFSLIYLLFFLLLLVFPFKFGVNSFNDFFKGTIERERLETFYFYFSICFPIFFLFISTIRLFKWKILIGMACVLLMGIVFYYPGLNNFIDKTFEIFRIGGGCSIRIVLPKDIACRYTSLLANDETNVCSQDEKYFQTKSIKLLFASDKFLFLWTPYHEGGWTKNDKEIGEIIKLDKKDVLTISYPGKGHVKDYIKQDMKSVKETENKD